MSSSAIAQPSAPVAAINTAPAACVVYSQSFLDTTIPAIFVSYQRGRIVIHPRYALLKIENVTEREAAKKYVGHIVCYRWVSTDGEIKENYGIIKNAHGTKGAVRALFERNLPPKALGGDMRVMLAKAENGLL